MINGMAESARGCVKEEMRMDIISSNLANSNVIGFKKDRISFQSLLEKADKGANSQDLVRVLTDMEQGDIRATENKLDLAIVGNGFFKVLAPEGVLYTRKGNFTLDTQGNLITQDGKMVLGMAGPVNLQGRSIEIDADGVVFEEGLQVAQLEVVDFENYGSLVKMGGGMFRDLSGNEIEKDPETTIRQGALELSNVNVVQEMVNMIQSVRAFESYQKSMKAIDEINNVVINQVGRLR